MTQPIAQVSFHIVGDVHGRADTLEELLGLLGYTRPNPSSDPYLWLAPPGFQLVSVGDLVDRGFESLRVLRIFMRMVDEGQAQVVMGNHEVRYLHLVRYLLGEEPELGPLPLSRIVSFAELLTLSRNELALVCEFLLGLPRFLLLDDGRCIISHARWEERFSQLAGDALDSACCFGRTGDGWPEADNTFVPPKSICESGVTRWESGARLHARARWATNWSGPETVFWGHHVVRPGEVVRIGHTVNVESGAFRGHCLSAYSYPEGTVTQVQDGRSWKAQVVPLLKAESLLFPRSLDSVRETISTEDLNHERSYSKFIAARARALGGEFAALQLGRLHRALFRRVREADEAERLVALG